MTTKILKGDCRALLPRLPSASVHCCVTSPPYYALRDYGVPGQIGLEPTPAAYIETMVAVFREVRRVLRDDGTLWLNLGDSYVSGGGTGQQGKHGDRCTRRHTQRALLLNRLENLPAKNMLGMPWRLAFALQADGWILRQDIIWHKPNPMPESVTDRCTKSHEYIFLLARSPRYFYDAQAIIEPVSGTAHERGSGVNPKAAVHNNTPDAIRNGIRPRQNASWSESVTDLVLQRNKRSVWTVPTRAYAEAHFATFPPALIKPCLLAGTSARGVCPACGAPWARLCEATAAYADFKEAEAARKGASMRSADPAKLGLTRGTANQSVSAAYVTTGWAPTCGCAREDTVPATVLDPFGGSGTTGMVATELGRSSILMELNPEYAALAHARTRVTPGLPLA